MSNPIMMELITADGEKFEMDATVAMQSELLKNMITDAGYTNQIIPLKNIVGKTMAKVVEYCNWHAENPNSDERDIKQKIKCFDENFVNVEQDVLFDLIQAANYLAIPTLLDLTCQAVANMIKGKTTEDIRKMFNIVNDLTPEEEKEYRRENAWAFQ